MLEAEPKPKVKLSEASVQLLKATATFVGAEIRKRFAPVEFLRSLDDFKQGRVVSDDVALNNPPPKTCVTSFRLLRSYGKNFTSLVPNKGGCTRQVGDVQGRSVASHFRYAHYLAFVRYCKASDLLRRYREGSTDYVPHRRKPGHQPQGWDLQN